MRWEGRGVRGVRIRSVREEGLGWVEMDRFCRLSGLWQGRGGKGEEGRSSV
jgi:hypothetical protein